MVAVGREMKGETVSGIWARRGWDPCGVVSERWKGEGGGGFREKELTAVVHVCC